MPSREGQAMKSLELALDHELTQLKQLKGEDRLSFASEYKDWLADDYLKERVCFLLH